MAGRLNHQADGLQWGQGDGALEEALSLHAVGRRVGQASMGPRQWSLGRAGPLSESDVEPPGFNGAKAMEPWKRARSEWQSLQARLASMGPRRWSLGRGGSTPLWQPPRHRSRLQWGQGNGALEERKPPSERARPSSSFNGATAMEPWKSPGNVGLRMAGVSSMGPRRLSRGRDRQVSDAVPRAVNGATAMEPWKSLPGRRTRLASRQASMGPRRWSRGRAAPCRPLTEGHRRASMGPRRWSRGRGHPWSCAQWIAIPQASMGPRRWSRGRGDGDVQISASDLLRLQWGHGDGAVEEAP